MSRQVPADWQRRACRYVHANTNASVDDQGTGACILVAVVINTKGLASNTLTLYDSATHGVGTTIAVIDTTSAIGTIPLMIQLATGLSFTMATGTAADITLIYQ